MSKGILRKFYTSREWRDFRRNLIIKRGPQCECCGKVFSDTSKLVGHHKIELDEQNVNDPNIALNEENVDINCHDCHNRDHRRFGYNQKKVYIIYGPPLSGKTTLVNQLSRKGDLILDIDKLYEAVSGQEIYNKPDNLRFNVFRIRDVIIDMIKTRYGQWCDAYIIGGYPQTYERERLAKELNAELIYCECTKEECIERLIQDKNKNNTWVKYIDRWFEQYS